MAATYDITTHPLLSKKAKSLFADDPGVFDTISEAAERSLGLHGTSFTGSDAEDAKLAIVYQVNYELEITPESQIMTSYKRGDRSFGYKSEMKATESRAQKIADRLLASQTTTSARQSKSMSVGVTHVW